MTIRGAESPDAPLFDDEARAYEAVLVMSFGGPEGPQDVVPFLRNVLREREVPPGRIEEIAEHYRRFGGVSPLNEQNRRLVRALEAELAARGPRLPVYLGNRNWHPLAADTLRRMREDGVRRAIVFVTSAFRSYSGCRQYREDLLRACGALGSAAPLLDKLRAFYNHPGFTGPCAENVRAALSRVPEERRDGVPVLFTAHSIPTAMARRCDYVADLEESCRLVAKEAVAGEWRLAFQSRSGPADVPWLGPDVGDVLDGLDPARSPEVVVFPIGFVSDHVEILYDLDTEAAARAKARGIEMIRAATVGAAPAFVRMIRDLIVERCTASPRREALGSRGPAPDVCPRDCCLPR